jgi:nucleoside phosphorylase
MNSTVTSLAAPPELTTVAKPNVTQTYRVAASTATPTAAAVPTAAVISQQAPAAAAEVGVNPLGVIAGVISNLVHSVLNPLAASISPDAPAGTPTLWSLLAFARREFETLFGSPPVTDTAANVQTTAQTLTDEQRTLVLTALPVEADAILARTTLDPNPTVVVDGHHFYLGTLGGKKVIVAMTGIGEVNATQTTETALDHFTPASGISIGAVVFDGVAGGSGRTEIGDVAVPARWTSDDGATWHAVDPSMLAAANTLTVNLHSTDSIGDPACHLCGPLASLPLINLNREPQLFVGGDGSTDDNNNGVAFPEIPLGGAIFGPQPLAAPDFSPLFFGNFFQALVPFLAQGLISNITGFLTAANPPVDAVDQETAAAQQVADAHGIPFLGIRGMSDGPGDPLPLPGYPFTFLVFKQIAADNAAIVTEDFLHSWAGP